MPADTQIHDPHDERNAAYVVHMGLDTPENRMEAELRLRLNGCRTVKHVAYTPVSDPRVIGGGDVPLALRTLGFIS